MAGVEEIVGLIGAIALLLLIIGGWVAYGTPLGFISLLLCDILGAEALCS